MHQSFPKARANRGQARGANRPEMPITKDDLASHHAVSNVHNHNIGTPSPAAQLPQRSVWGRGSPSKHGAPATVGGDQRGRTRRNNPAKRMRGGQAIASCQAESRTF